MRLRKSQLKTYCLKKQIAKKNNEGSSYLDYGDPLSFDAEIYPASGKIQVELYGERLTYILNMITTFKDVEEGYGVCVYTSANPDYRIVSVKRYQQHIYCELEKIR